MRTLLNLIKSITILITDTLITPKCPLLRRKSLFVYGKIRHYANEYKHKAQCRRENLLKPIWLKGNEMTSLLLWLFLTWQWWMETRIGWLILALPDTYRGEEVIYFGDSRSTLVLGKGKILLKLTSGKTFSLSNVLHVPKIKYNLVSIYIQRKIGIKVSF